MNKTHRIKVLGLLSLPLLAIALAVMVFAWGSSTDTAEAANPGAAMGLRVDAAQTQICPGTKTSGETCVALGANFDIIVSADAIPAGYVLAQTWLNFGNTGLTFKAVQEADPDALPDPLILITTTVLWPNCVTDVLVGSYDAENVSAGCLTGVISTPASTHKGDLYSFSFNCTTDKSTHTIVMETLGSTTAGTSGAAYKESAGAGGNTVPVPSVELLVNCTNPNTPTPTPTDTPTPTPTPTDTPAPIPRMQKLPLLQNVFLTRQGLKIPPPDCLAGDNIGILVEALSQTVVSPDPKGLTEDPGFQQLAAFEFEVHYDATKVCVTVIAGISFPELARVCVVEDSNTKPQLEGVARVGCITIGKGHDINDTAPLAAVLVYPQPGIYSQAKPNQGNGVVVQINNVGCDLSDEQGEAIPIFSCDDADITFRYLEGDVVPSCEVDAADAQAIAFRWGSEKGNVTIYKDFMNLEPSGTQADNDIDINDLQFVFGRFGSSCLTPHPDQPPVNPKA